MEKIFLIENLDQLPKVAAWICKKLQPNTLILLKGNLGTGKTTLVKYIAGNLGYPARLVKSPTFSLLNIYKLDKFNFYHMDLYRLNRHDYFLFEEMKELLREEKSVLLIEWPEKMLLTSLQEIAKHTITIGITNTGKNFRKFNICVK